jgi:CubicO group peptidase (beta-lactamase class C family)
MAFNRESDPGQRRREEIEYPVAGGGIYSKTSDYVLLLQYLLRQKLALENPSRVTPSPVKILSDDAIRSLFSPTLPESAYESLLAMYNPYLANSAAEDMLKPGDADWSTAMAIYKPKNGRRRGGWGRLPGSVGWGGAAGTEYFIDVESGIAVSGCDHL